MKSFSAYHAVLIAIGMLSYSKVSAKTYLNFSNPPKPSKPHPNPSKAELSKWPSMKSNCKKCQILQWHAARLWLTTSSVNMFLIVRVLAKISNNIDFADILPQNHFKIRRILIREYFNFCHEFCGNPKDSHCQINFLINSTGTLTDDSLNMSHDKLQNATFNELQELIMMPKDISKPNQENCKLNQNFSKISNSIECEEYIFDDSIMTETIGIALRYCFYHWRFYHDAIEKF